MATGSDSSGGGAGVRLKDFLNEQAGKRFAQLGYSDARARDAKREAWWWYQARTAALSRRRRLRAGRTVVWPERGRAELVPVEVAEAGAGEVTVTLLATVVSPGTERAQLLGLGGSSVRYPYRPGYCGAGLVTVVGRGVKGLAPGDLVAVRNAPHQSVVTVPAGSVHRVPDHVAPHDAALAQLGVVAAQGLRLAGDVTGRRVCVTGAGLVGLLVARLAAAAGAADVVVAAASRSKEAAVFASGARLVTDDEHELEAIRAPIVIEASGQPAGLATALAAAADGARIVLLGSTRERTALPVDLLRERRLTLIGAHVSTLGLEGGPGIYREQAERFLGLVASGEITVTDLVSEPVDPREADAFYRRLADDRTLVAAHFDWTTLHGGRPAPRSRLLRLPDLTARGVDAKVPARVPAPPLPRRAGVPSSRPTLGLALVGCGDIAVQNAAAIAQAEGARLVASFDPQAQLAADLARAYGGDVAGAFESLLGRSDVDAVFLCVPHHLHAPLAVAAAEAGKHVIVEKPPARDLAGAIEMSQAAARAGVALSVCFPQRYDPRAVALRQAIRAGALGKLEGVFVTYFADKTPAYWRGGFSGRALSDWRASREHAGGGVLIMNASHHVDLIRFLTGTDAERVVALTSAQDEDAVEDTISVSIRYPGGAVGTLAASSARPGTRSGSGEIAVWGSEGSVVLASGARIFSLRTLDGLPANRWLELAELPARNIRQAYVEQFAVALARDVEPDIGPADALAVQAFLEAAYRSAELGEAVSPTELIQAVRA